MARRRKRLRQLVRHTALELRKWSKTRLIRLILRLEGARISRIGRRSRGKSRKVKVLANGQWRFMKGGAKSKRRTRRRRR